MIAEFSIVNYTIRYELSLYSKSFILSFDLVSSINSSYATVVLHTHTHSLSLSYWSYSAFSFSFVLKKVSRKPLPEFLV